MFTDEYITLHSVGTSHNPAPYTQQPISVRAENNDGVFDKYDFSSHRKLFLNNHNVKNMTYLVVSLNHKNNATVPKDVVKQHVPSIMKEWADKVLVDEFKSAADNRIITLEFVNKKFLADNCNLYNKNARRALNMFKMSDIVTDKYNNAQVKKYDEMTAEDYRTLNVWRPQRTYAANSQSRYCNKVPIWQKSMNIRQYDVANDGLHTATPERASLDTQIHGYDMSNIVKGSTNYENYYFEHI